MKKYIWCAVLAIALAALAAVPIVSSWGQETPEPVPLAFSVPSEGGEKRISCWTEDERTYYVFLPSYAELKQVQVRTDERLELDGVRLADGDFCDGFALNKAYPLSLGDRTGSLRFMQSANVGTIYVETESGSMDDIHKGKDYRETINMAAYTAEGELDYSSAGTDAMNGRGNSTWKEDKKPYNLHLSEPKGLLGLPEGNKWCLLANVYDASNLRNWLVYSLANRVGFSWSPDVTFVDLYLNGEYNGLYLLVEAIQVEEGKLNLSEDGCLLSLDYRYRAEAKKNPTFLAKFVRAVSVDYPPVFSEAAMEELKAYIGAMENAMASQEGVDPDTGRSWQELVDQDSWARKYLIEEISENFDSGITSQYFYFDRDENGPLPIAAGPVWDYDLALAPKGYPLVENPRCLYASEYPNGIKGLSWYGLLYRQPEFYDRVTELFGQEYLPVLEEQVSFGISQKAAEISDASEMNEERWRSMGMGLHWEDEAVDVQQFLAERTEFLKELWVEKKEYHTIGLSPTGVQDIWRYYTVEHGQAWEDMPLPEDIGLSGDTWYVQETGEVFDPQEPVTSDLVLLAPERVNLNQQIFSLARNMGGYWLPAVLLLALAALLLADRVCNWRKGR